MNNNNKITYHEKSYIGTKESVIYKCYNFSIKKYVSDLVTKFRGNK